MFEDLSSIGGGDAAIERQMHAMGGGVLEGVGGEFAKCRRQHAGIDLFDQRFHAAAVFDQIRDGADLQAMFCCKFLQVRQTGHGAVVLHDFANHRGG